MNLLDCIRRQDSSKKIDTCGAGQIRKNGWLFVSPCDNLHGAALPMCLGRSQKWKRRWFVLSLVPATNTSEQNQYQLHCYSSDKSRTPAGTVDPSKITDLNKMSPPPQDVLSRLDWSKYQGEQDQEISQMPFFCFEATCFDCQNRLSRRRFHLLAEKPMEMHDWVKHLRVASGHQGSVGDEEPPPPQQHVVGSMSQQQQHTDATPVHPSYSVHPQSISQHTQNSANSGNQIMSSSAYQEDDGIYRSCCDKTDGDINKPAVAATTADPEAGSIRSNPDDVYEDVPKAGGEAVETENELPVPPEFIDDPKEEDNGVYGSLPSPAVDIPPSSGASASRRATVCSGLTSQHSSHVTSSGSVDSRSPQLPDVAPRQFRNRSPALLHVDEGFNPRNIDYENLDRIDQMVLLASEHRPQNDSDSIYVNMP